MYLCKFSYNFRKNWSAGNSLVMRDHLVMLVDGGSTVIVSEMAMWPAIEVNFGWCGGGLVLDWANLRDF
jgi:hypothetical protein